MSLFVSAGLCRAQDATEAQPVETAPGETVFEFNGTLVRGHYCGDDCPYCKGESGYEGYQFQQPDFVTNIPGMHRRVGETKDYSHRFEGGIVAVLGGTSLRFSSGPYKGKRGMSYGAGLYGQFNMGMFAIRPEVLYERNGARYEYGKLWTNSVTVPVNLLLQTSRNNNGGAYLAFGGYYRYAFSGYVKGSAMEFDDMFRNHEAGLQWGFGLWISRVTLGVTFRYGLGDINKSSWHGPDGTDPDIRNRSTQFVMSYRF